MAGSCFVNISEFSSHPQAISFQVVEGRKSWVCTAVYANPRVVLRQQVWTHLRELGGRITLPWLVLGDFNEIMLSTECRGGSFSIPRASQFLEVLNDCNLLDMGAKGLRFTWFGDRNTSFFHAQTIARRRRNKIQGLFLPDGTWHTDPVVLKTEAVRFYKDLFSINSDQDSLDMHTGVPSALGVEAQSALTAPVTKEEVRRAVMSMKSYKAPGPDGFQPFFFKQYWPIVGDELWRTVRDAFQLGFSEVSLLETQMVLIPKVDHPVSLKEFRPISLCNVAWKVISKVLVARLRPFLPDVIGPFQGSFIPGRGTRDHSIIAQEAFHFVRRERSGVGSLALKIDLEKAYDRVRWDFLESTLLQFGFPPVTIQLIMWGLKNSTISLLWNGSTLPPFAPSRGLRQGDPLSPYLFVFCMERLALRISEMLQKGQWKPIQLSPGGLLLSHLLFADDILLFCQASEGQAHLVASILGEFSRSLGLKVNLNKSKFVSSRRVSQRRIDTLEGLLGIGHTTRIGKYLGVPMTHGQPRCADFKDVMDKIQGRLAAWKSKLLNKAGKLCLVKSTISSIPVYSMQTLWLPQAVCNRIDQACRRMLWAKSDSTRFWSPVSWDVVTQPMTFGGLGVREARRVNLSLLGKLIWDLLTAPQKPWVHILSSIYLHGDSILCAQNRRGASPTWLSLIKALPSLREGFEPHLGSGASSLWYTDWSGTGLWCGRVPFVHIADTNRTFADYWVSDHWDFNSLYTAIPAGLIQSVQRLTVANASLGLDHFAWRGDSSWCYTAASGYRFLATGSSIEEDEVWKKLWKLRLPEKVKFFLWQCFHSALPTN
uniref:Transposon TX1 uncharacterized n=1 Tax=Cajanus cajan TaxID=3821 RepID=A0A151S8J7_CAJCA|nr:Transposon TX1 uncharacterized [Cajanus cajan]